MDGLVKLDQFTEKYATGFNLNIDSDEPMKEKRINRLKHRAAEKGAPILDVNSKVSYYKFSGGTYAVVNGFTFDYPQSLNSVKD